MEPYDQNRKHGELTRNLQEDQLGGVIFGCSDDTIDECFRKQLFGSPSVHYSYVKNVKVGMPMFLFNYSDRKLHGIFEAASPGQMYIDPNAWMHDGSSGTAFPAQVPAVPNPKKVTTNSKETNPLCILSDRSATFIWADDKKSEELVKPTSEADGEVVQKPVVAAEEGYAVVKDEGEKKWWSNLDPNSVPSWLKVNWEEVTRKNFAHIDDKEDISEEEEEEEEFEYSYALRFPRLEENDKLSLPMSENNFDIWRQLWKILEQCDLLLTVVDARDPLFYRCPDLEAYAKTIDEHKRTILLVNKADLLPLNIRKRWAEYFKQDDIPYVFWSAKAATATLEGKKLSGYSEEESASLDLDTKVYGRDELLMRLQAEAESIVAQKKTSTAEEDHDVSSSDSVLSVAKHVVVGFVGYPNVGKSSTINVLVGEKRTGVTHTPGKTEHFQTLIISEELTLCDCPGIILPCFSTSRHELSPEETNIHKLAVINLSNKINKGLAAVQVNREDNTIGLRILAEDVRIWMETNGCSNAQILSAPYINLGNEIVKCKDHKTVITKSLTKMIREMRNLHSLIHSKEHLFTHVQGQAFKLFKDRCLTVAMDRTMLLIDKLEALLEHLLRWDGEWNGVSMVSPEGFKKTLVRKCQIYRYTLASKLFVPEVFENQYGIQFEAVDHTEVLDDIYWILRSKLHIGATVSVTRSSSPSTTEDFLEMKRKVMQGSIKEINPEFKGERNLVSVCKSIPRCTYCFDGIGFYFTSCCQIILCDSCAVKKRVLMCGEAHERGVNLHFPIVVKKLVGRKTASSAV